MNEPEATNVLATTAAVYQLAYTIATPANGRIQQIIGPNPKRWFIRIISSAPIGTAGIFPFPVPAGAGAAVPQQNDISVKFVDAPALCTGAWFGLGAPAVQYHIWEESYTRG